MAHIVFLLDSRGFEGGSGSDLCRVPSQFPVSSAFPKATTHWSCAYHTQKRRANCKICSNHGYVLLMNSETVQEVIAWLYNQLPFTLVGKDGRFQSLAPKLLSFCMSGSQCMCQASSACASYVRNALPPLGQHSSQPASCGVSQALISCLGAILRQIKFKAPHLPHLSTAKVWLKYSASLGKK